MPGAAPHATRSRGLTEKQVQRNVTLALRAFGFAVTDYSQPRATKQTPGIPDLYGQHAAWRLRVWVEVKTAKGKTSPAQERWHAQERAAGGTVLVVRSASDLSVQLRALGAPIC